MTDVLIALIALAILSFHLRITPTVLSEESTERKKTVGKISGEVVIPGDTPIEILENSLMGDNE